MRKQLLAEINTNPATMLLNRMRVTLLFDCPFVSFFAIMVMVRNTRLMIGGIEYTCYNQMFNGADGLIVMHKAA